MNTNKLPTWLTEAITNLVTAAYEAGLAAGSTQSSPPVAAKDVFTLSEAAKELRVSMATLNKLVTSGALGSYYVGRRRFVRLSHIEAYRSQGERVAA